MLTTIQNFIIILDRLIFDIFNYNFFLNIENLDIEIKFFSRRIFLIIVFEFFWRIIEFFYFKNLLIWKNDYLINKVVDIFYGLKNSLNVIFCFQNYIYRIINLFLNYLIIYFLLEKKIFIIKTFNIFSKFDYLKYNFSGIFVLKKFYYFNEIKKFFFKQTLSNKIFILFLYDLFPIVGNLKIILRNFYFSKYSQVKKSNVNLVNITLAKRTYFFSNQLILLESADLEKI